MSTIATDRSMTSELSSMLEIYDCPAILVSSNYEILGWNKHYIAQYGEIDHQNTQHCFSVSHGYTVPCDQAGEACPLAAAQESGHKERVLHVHQTPRGNEHVDVEMLPIFDKKGELLYFVELLRDIPTVGAAEKSGKMVGASRSFNHMLSKVARLSESDASVLLLGESGTGKELVATALHCGSLRKNKPLVTVECSGLTDSLFESELFGHVRGAFTGAHSRREGLVESVNGGTLFLDEIGDVPLSMQVKLLRLLETGTYRPVGSTEVKRADFRLVCATHKNIWQMVEEGSFRRDLYFRVNVFPIKLPALSERLEDIPLLVGTLLKSLRADKDFFLTDSAIQVLKAHTYSGNIRELKNILNRATVLSDTNVIESVTIEECLAMDISPDTSIEAAKAQALNLNTPWMDLKTAEQKYIEQLMDAHAGDKDAVAGICGISLRSLYRKLEEAQAER